MRFDKDKQIFVLETSDDVAGAYICLNSLYNAVRSGKYRLAGNFISRKNALDNIDTTLDSVYADYGEYAISALVNGQPIDEVIKNAGGMSIKAGLAPHIMAWGGGYDVSEVEATTPQVSKFVEEVQRLTTAS